MQNNKESQNGEVILTVVSEIESWGYLYYQTVKLGTQSKLYEKHYSQMILAI